MAKFYVCMDCGSARLPEYERYCPECVEAPAKPATFDLFLNGTLFQGQLEDLLKAMEEDAEDTNAQRI